MAYNPDQPRDERGRWGDGGAAGTHGAAAATAANVKGAGAQDIRAFHSPGRARERALTAEIQSQIRGETTPKGSLTQRAVNWEKADTAAERSEALTRRITR